MIHETPLAEGRVQLSLRDSDGVEIAVFEGSRSDAYRAARISLLHELVRRDDIRETGAHAPCDACARIASWSAPR